MVPGREEPPVREGSGGEFAAFAIRHQPVLVAIARNVCGKSASDCDDLVQDVLLRALLQWERLKRWPEPARRAWLVRVLHNRFLDQCRRQGAETDRRVDLHNVHMLFEDPEDAPEPEQWECVTEDELRQAVARLNEKLRQAFELHARGLRHAEIARRMNTPSAGTVGTWLFHARRRLKAMLHDTAERRRQERER
ncbi:sigma-70 family RNA polymerase sigma factor [Corallococcus exiguus]|uniref:ECF subfamily RNA polymerase sigma factor n=1 Tax=Corallococcus coralloides TaxID=184914 RepID=A0A410RPP2_CORCK|nr:MULTISPECIES: sigma-70 family RNA polymerase sigma factor [Corallococcus]RKI24355.1 sigma-70 family RNA polymerase sigma factor [Corallococcus sp. AB004]RYZ43144.1 MAG: sigma-70 family RNA polymerase sigma factor [Myxococcaceae bacterium]MBN8472165.1 sigma-70 family RNA polymerase sigma factor [Corallococcus exiguus]MBN9686791.1 sigma-70 family RNA polymerase sigma factor [Corallococcus sp. NCSPR001]MBZ4333243.1 sigma-70 family RNA polymerase sigma factor [Corallococcus sp. AS-1-12]